VDGGAAADDEGDGTPVAPQALDQLRRLAARDPDQVAELVRVYAREGGARVEAASSALADAQLDSVARIAHSLKGSSATFGADVVASLCEQVEVACAARDPVAATAVLGRVAAELQRATTALQHLFPGAQAEGSGRGG